MTKIIGIGPGDLAFLYPLALKEIARADVLIGGRRNLKDFAYLGKETLAIGNNLAEVAAYIRREESRKNIVVLASGDTSLFSIAKVLKTSLPDLKLEFYPGIGALQYLLAKIGGDMEDMKIISLHGKSCPSLLHVLRHNRKVAIFTGGADRPQDVAAKIPWQNIRVTVGEHLSYPEERIVCGSPAAIAAKEFSGLSLMVLEREGEIDVLDPYLGPGLPNDDFCRDQVPMTKAEVRAVIISKLRLKQDSRVLEIGCGTGSVTVEMARLVGEGRIWALEQNPAAVALSKKNFDRFHLDNIELIAGAAPADIPAGIGFDRVFIGGSRGHMAEIVAALPGSVRRIVAAAIAVETVVEAKEALLEQGFGALEIVSLTLAKNKAAGEKNLMIGENPIYIIAGDRG